MFPEQTARDPEKSSWKMKKIKLEDEKIKLEDEKIKLEDVSCSFRAMCVFSGSTTYPSSQKDPTEVKIVGCFK